MTTRICRNCGTELEAGSVGDLCPNCQVNANETNAAEGPAPAPPSEEPCESRPPTDWERIVAWATRNQGIAGLVVGIVFALAVVLMWWVVAKRSRSATSAADSFQTQPRQDYCRAKGLVFIQAGSFTMGSPANEVGSFTMGSPENEVDKGSDKGPQTRVTITRGFYMSIYEVTQGEYVSITGSNPSFFLGDLNLPVEKVSWFDATNYCGLLTKRERQFGLLPKTWVYRLPTEAEWEYACRAGTTTRFSSGDDLTYTALANYAWYEVNSGNQTHPVGQKAPNPWGLYDMHGNVWEWCQDYYDSRPGGGVVDPQGPANGNNHVLRGGSTGTTGAVLLFLLH